MQAFIICLILFRVAQHLAVIRRATAATQPPMINRIQQILDERAEVQRRSEYFAVVGEFGQVFVNRETATRLRRTINRLFAPAWIEFMTITGSRITIRTRQVSTIAESTAEQRAAARKFWRDREAEENADQRPWDPD